MNYQIIDDALPEESFLKIKNSILCPNFPWHFSKGVTSPEDSLPTTSSYYFTHTFWDGFNVEPQAKMFAPILVKIECRSVLRIKGNLYPSTETIMHHTDHADYGFPHHGAIFYLNTNNGLTILENKIEVESIENRILLFDSSKPHRSTTCTDDKCRVNVNFNYF